MWIDQKTRVFVYQKPIDMRWGFERLSFLIREEMKQSIDYGDLFLFLGNNRRRLKGLRFDGSGLVLFAKRTEKKSFMSVAELSGREQIEMIEIPIDNNPQERQMRNPVIGRKTWLGNHSLKGARTTAILTSIVESCKLAGLSPRDYFKKRVHAKLFGQPMETPRELADL